MLHLLLTLQLVVQQPVTPEAVVRQFYADKVAGDGTAAAALFDEAAPERAAIPIEVSNLARARCTELLSIDVRATEVSADRATVEAKVMLRMTAALPNPKEIIESDSARFTLRRASATWRIVERRRDTFERAERLGAADPAQRAELLRDEANRQPEVALRLCAMAIAAVNRADVRHAEELLRIADQIAADNGDDRSLAAARTVESIVLRRGATRDIDRTIAAARTAVTHADASGDPDVIARAYLVLARAETMNRLPAAHDGFVRAISLGDALLDPSPAAYAASSMGEASNLAGDHFDEFHWGRVALRYADLSGQMLARASAEKVLAGAYMAQSQCEEATPHLRRLLDAARRVDFYDGIIDAVNMLDGCHRFPHKEREAIRILDETMETLGTRATLEMRAAQHRAHALAKFHRGDLAGAEIELREQLRIAEESKLALLVAQALNDLTECALAQHHARQALALLDRAAAIEGTNMVLHRLYSADAYRQLGAFSKALAELRALVSGVEAERPRFAGGDIARQQAFAARIRPYNDLADVLTVLGQPAEALFAADRGKARTLLERLPRTAGDVTDRLRVGAIIHRDDLAPLVSRDAAAVEFCVTASNVLAFTLRRGSNGVRVRAHRLLLAPEVISAEVGSYQRLLARRDVTYLELSRRLYDQLIAPVAADLAGARVVALVPDGALWQLPFESLLDPSNRFLGERFATFYIPSLAAYKVMLTETRSVKPPHDFLAFANAIAGEEVHDREILRGGTSEPLPDAEREVKSAARNFPSSTLYLEDAALESRAKKESGGYRVVHFATHAQFDDVDPMRSYLVLTPGADDDGLLETREMLALKLNADLVVLSACETARGEIHPGEGVVGMTWAIFVAGCPSVIATQWKVASRESADLMIAYYADWQRRGDAPFAKAEALRTARLKLLRQASTRHPFYWAPFVIIGKP